jgi:hypothetical protein
MPEYEVNPRCFWPTGHDSDFIRDKVRRRGGTLEQPKRAAFGQPRLYALRARIEQFIMISEQPSRGDRPARTIPPSSFLGFVLLAGKSANGSGLSTCLVGGPCLSPLSNTGAFSKRSVLMMPHGKRILSCSVILRWSE